MSFISAVYSSALFFPLLVTPLALAQQAAQKPLPDIRQLMSEAREHQKQLDKIRENYTFSVAQVTQELDGKGHVTKTESTNSEVFFVNGQAIEREVNKDGKPLSEHDQQKETERVTKAVEKAQNPKSGKPNNDNVSLRHILDVVDVRNPRRESYNGRATIVFDFVGRRDFKAHGLSEDLSKKLQGTVWIDEADRQVARMEATFNDNFHVAAGFLANVQKGTSFRFDQAPVNGEIWLPSGTDINLQMRVLLFKGVRAHITEHISDYKRFRVETGQAKGTKVVTEKKP
jgi:hypothetical protein